MEKVVIIWNVSSFILYIQRLKQQEKSVRAVGTNDIYWQDNLSLSSEVAEAIYMARL